LPGHQVACYRLSAGGAAKVWDLPADRYHYPVHSAGNGSIVGLEECHVAFANGGRADTSGKRPYLVVVELATGKVVQEVCGGEGATVPVDWGAPTFVAADDLLVAMRDNWHCKTDFYTFRLAGARVTPFGGTFALPHWPTTSYEIPMVYPVVDGRLFIRGALGIYCYDLRQPGPVTP